MAGTGIVAEYNPFHTGHRWHIAETRRQLGAESAIVCAMSGHWVQRGDCAVTDKWKRAAWAVEAGADLVLELPTVWACASAETFARGAVEVLAGTGVVDTLSFGSECADLAALRASAAVLEEPEYHARVKELSAQGLPFPMARQQAAEERLGGPSVLDRPNANLAVEYLRAIPPHWRALAVQRQGVDHDGGAAGGFASASHLRELLRAGNRGEAEPYLCTPWAGEIADFHRCGAVLLDRVRTMEEADWAALPDGGSAEGLPARLVRCGRQARSAEEFLALAKTKRFPLARLRRLLTWAYLGLTAADRPEHVPYLRVLAFSERGRTLLGEMKEKATLPVLTKPAHARDLPEEGRRLFELESRCTDRFGLCLGEVPPCGVEWTRSPVYVRRKSGDCR